MELSEFAKNILFSGSLKEKLHSPLSFSDLQPLQCVSLPSLPQRSGALELSRWKHSARVSFPTKSELVDPVKVGVLLHFFANHELLALELMALALLKFPDAPGSFRMGVAQTMLDEQKHLAAYIAKMNAVGIEFGDISVNDFFWAQCASMVSPLDYVTRMSMTFEQANLDFASYFRDVLVEVGDHETASLLQTVLEDEIGHVKHGLMWFRRWKSQSSSDWEAFCVALGGELNPARAKGSIYHEAARIKAGFCQDYIQSLKIYSQSKGGLARISYFNPDAEEELRSGGGRPVLKPVLELLRVDLEPVMLFVMNGDDVLATSRELPRDFLLELQNCGFELPERLVAQPEKIRSFVKASGRRLSHLLPWAPAPSVHDFAETLNLPAETSTKLDRNSLRLIYSKSFAVELLAEFLEGEGSGDVLMSRSDLGAVVRDESGFEQVSRSIFDGGRFSHFVAKRPWSASGRHRIVSPVTDVAFADQPEALKRWFEKSWRLGEYPLVQPFFKRRLDFSVQARVERFGREVRVYNLGMTRIINHPNGQYCGSIVGRFLSGESSELLKFWHNGTPTDPRGVEVVMELLVQFVGRKLASLGFTGAFGIDCFLFQDSDGRLKLHPMIEINPRYTMGRVALSMAKRMAPGRTGLWLHIPASWLQSFGVASFQELKSLWMREQPLQTKSQSGGTVISSGVLETTPASCSERVWTCFAVSQNLQQLLGQLGLERFVSVSVSQKTIDTLVLQP